MPGARIRVRKGGRAWHVSVPRLGVLREVVVASIGGEAITRLEVRVASWRPPIAGWIGTPGVRGLTSQSVEVDGTGATVILEALEPVDPGVLCAGALRCLQPARVPSTPEMRTYVPSLDASASCLAVDVHDVLVEGDNRDRHVRRADVLVTATPNEPVGIESAHRVAIVSSHWSRDGHDVDVLLDPAVHRPMGRRTGEGQLVVPATVDGAAVVLSMAGKPLRLEADITASQVRAVRDVGAIVTDGVIDRRLAVQLNACGVLVRTTNDELPVDTLSWQQASVSERRHALRAHSPAVAFDAWPSVSVVVATHRPEHLGLLFDNLRSLSYPRLEAVIALHGGQLDIAHVRALCATLPFPSRVIEVPSSSNLGEVLNVCSQVADGDVLTKMDDDDYYGAEHIWDLVIAHMYSGAQVVGKALDWIYLVGDDTTVLRPTYAAEKYADFVAGGTMLVTKADLLSVGGWRPVPKSVDRALLDRVLADGGLVYRTHGLGYVYVRHGAGHTASVADEHFLTKTAEKWPGLVRHPALGTGEGPITEVDP